MKSQQLFDAAWNGDLAEIHAICATPDAIGGTALNHALGAAAYNAKPEACRILLELGADPNTRGESTREAVLHHKSAKDAHGESPLTWASWHEREDDVLKLLLYGEFKGSIP